MRLPKKQQILLAMFGTSLSLLFQGCAENTAKQVKVGESAYRWASTIYYDETEISGTISYNTIEKNFVKLVTLEYNGKTLDPILMAINFYEFHPMRGGVE